MKTALCPNIENGNNKIKGSSFILLSQKEVLSDENGRYEGRENEEKEAKKKLTNRDRTEGGKNDYIISGRT